MKILSTASLDKYFLAQEREGLSFLSHVSVEFENEIEPSVLQQAMLGLNALPIFRMRFIQQNNKFKRILLDETAELTQFIQISSNLNEENFIQSPIDLACRSPFQIYRSHCGKIIYLTLHHAAGDGFTQGYLLDQFIKALNDVPLQISDAQEAYGSTLSEQMSQMSLKFIIIFLFKPLTVFFTKRPPAFNLSQAPLQSKRNLSRQHVDFTTTEWKQITTQSKLVKSTPFEWLTYQYAQTLKEFNSTQKPVVLLVPVNLRGKFKKYLPYQNFTGLLWISFSASLSTFVDFKMYFRKLIKTNQAFQLMPLIGLMARTQTSNQLKERLQKNEINQTQAFSTSLVSIGQIPSSLFDNEKWTIKSLKGFGNTERSPGLTLTGLIYKNRASLTLSHLVGHFDEKILQDLFATFKKNILK